MKATFWLGAAALGALLSAGCQDNQALGTERTHDVVPNQPAPLDPVVPNQPAQVREGNPIVPSDPMTHPDQEGVGEAAKVAPPSLKEPTAEAVKNDLTSRADEGVDSSKATMNVVQYVDGEDLSDVPEQIGPLWSNY